MVTKTLFANTNAISWTAGNALAVNDVADGEIAVIDIKTGLAVASIAPDAGLAANTKLQIVQGTASGEAQILSKIFSYGSIKDWFGKIPDAAAVSQVSTVTVSSADATSDCTLKVVDLTEGYEPFPRRSWTVQVGAFTDVNTLAAAFRAAIAADTSVKNFISVSGSGAAIVLTHKVGGNSFRTAFDPADGTSSVSVAATTAPSIGVGLAAQMKEIEAASQYTRGRQTTNYFPQEYPSFVTGTAYNQYVLHLANDNDRNVLRENQVNQIIIGVNAAIADDGTVDDAYKKLFEDSTHTIA